MNINGKWIKGPEPKVRETHYRRRCRYCKAQPEKMKRCISCSQQGYILCERTHQVVLYQSEWRKVLETIRAIPKPTVELKTLAGRVETALQTKHGDPFYLAITDYQEDWISSRCLLVTINKRPKSKV